MIRSYCTKLAWTIVFLLGVWRAEAQSVPPNIVVFFVDDLGWQDMSEPFYKEVTPINKKFHTPNLEILARESVKFTNAYATPVCTPSRVSFLTGLNAARHRVTNWTHPVANRPTDNKDEVLSPPDWNINGLSPVPDIEHTVFATPLPKLLRDQGYFTIHVGKAHWGSAGTPGASPLNLGFMVNIAGHAAGHPQSYYGEQNYGNLPGKTSYQAVPDLMEYYGTPTFLTEALTRDALKSLEEPLKRKQPVFLNFSNYAVHVPIQADPRFVQRYLDAGLDSTEAAYASLVEGYDKSIGDIVRYLKEHDAYDNTVILFVSDNGGLSLTPARSGEIHTQNLPLRAGKGSVYEGGIRVPLLIKNVKSRKPKVEDTPVIMEDLFPTILEIAGVRNRTMEQKQIDGRSVCTLLEGKGDDSWENRNLIWHVPNKWINTDGPGINFFSAIRKGDYKLLYDMKRGKLELYNIAEDIGEKYDLNSKMKSKTVELSKLLSDELRNRDAQLPVDKRTGLPVKYPDQL
ncbi:sulfatase [Sphingobacterium spiritivorum]|uniref:sulfatase n=1 Tax=Sphingobacterium spiritivorum TaxID=258 RepID=UPI003DA68356